MDPGANRNLIKVVYRQEVNGPLGTTFEEKTVGTYWAMITYLTRALAYSGNEAYSDFEMKTLIPTPVIRFTFNLENEFDYDKVEFHYKGKSYIPRDFSIRINGTRGTQLVYSCWLQTPRLV